MKIIVTKIKSLEKKIIRVNLRNFEQDCIKSKLKAYRIYMTLIKKQNNIFFTLILAVEFQGLQNPSFSEKAVSCLQQPIDSFK